MGCGWVWTPERSRTELGCSQPPNRSCKGNLFCLLFKTVRDDSETRAGGGRSS